MKALLYMVMQFTGAAFGAFFTVQLTDSDYHHCANLETIAGKTGSVFGWELLATFVLVWVVHATAVSKPSIAPGTAPFAIGIVIAATCGINGQYTGGYANPARFFGPLVMNSCLGSYSHM